MGAATMAVFGGGGGEAGDGVGGGRRGRGSAGAGTRPATALAVVGGAGGRRGRWRGRRRRGRQQRAGRTAAVGGDGGGGRRRRRRGRRLRSAGAAVRGACVGGGQSARAAGAAVGVGMWLLSGRLCCVACGWPWGWGGCQACPGVLSAVGGPTQFNMWPQVRPLGDRARGRGPAPPGVPARAFRSTCFNSVGVIAPRVRRARKRVRPRATAREIRETLQRSGPWGRAGTRPSSSERYHILSVGICRNQNMINRAI